MRQILAGADCPIAANAPCITRKVSGGSVARRSFQLLTVLALRPHSLATGPFPPSASITSRAEEICCMGSPYSPFQRNASLSKPTMDDNFSNRENVGMSGDTLFDIDYTNEAVGRRLRVAREAVFPGESQAAVAKKFEVTDGGWSKWERGQNTLRRDVANELRKFGVESDWLLFGDPKGLTPDMRRRLAEADERIQSVVPKGRKAAIG